MSKYKYNVGQVVLRQNGCFWIFPSGYIKNKDCIICSPWFSYMGEKWRLVKEPYFKATANKGTVFCYKYSDLVFRLWKRVRSSLPEYKYTIQLSLKTANGDELIKCVGDVDSDYGCQLKFPDMKDIIIPVNGLLKLFFDIQREEYEDIAPESKYGSFNFLSHFIYRGKKRVNNRKVVQDFQGRFPVNIFRNFAE